MQFNKLRNSGWIVYLIVLTACGGGGDDEGDSPPVPVTTTHYTADFSPTHVIGGTAAPATVSASATLSTANGEDIVPSGNVTVSGTSATSVTINVGYAGENGPPAVTLTNAGGGRWDIPANTEIDLDELFRLDATGYYIWIETPDGSLRGQILPPGWAVGTMALDAGSVVPTSTSTGSGKAGFAINPQTGALRARITLNGVSDAISAGIRNAIAGARGDVIISMEQSTSNANVWGSRDIGNPDASSRLEATGLDLLLSGALYFSVESTSNVEGDLRAQIIDDVINVFDTELTTSEVVSSSPPVASDATGTATVTWIDALSKFAVAVNTDAENVLSVSIHQGLPGVNGTLLFSLTPDFTVSGNWVLPMSDLEADQKDALESGEFYVSVVTASSADGELRGQIYPQNSTSTSTKLIGESGGELSVVDEAGIAFDLSVSPDALVGEPIAMSMSVAEPPAFLPAGLTSLLAVKLEPSGTAFGDFPIMEIRGSLPAGPKVAFIANDDGTVIDYRLFLDDDPIAASLATDLVKFDVPHFSTAGVARLDNSCSLQPDTTGRTAEEVANSEITAYMNSVACDRSNDIDTPVDYSYLSDLMRRWYLDLEERTTSAPIDQLKTFGDLLFEYERYGSKMQNIGLEHSVGSDRAAENLGLAFTSKLADIDSTCSNGQIQSAAEFLKWLAKPFNAFRGGKPESWAKPTIECLVTARLTPDGPHAIAANSESVVIEPIVTGASGQDLSQQPVLALNWEHPVGLTRILDGNRLEVDTSNVGLREARLVSTYFVFADDPRAYGVVVYDHTGTRAVSADGSASNCTDPDDNGQRLFRFSIPFSSQTIVATSETSATVTFSGSGSIPNIAIDNMSVTVVYDDNTDVSLGGTATGSISFTETGVDEDTGEPFTNSGSLGLGADAVSSDLFSFANASGSDSFGCALNGTVGIEQVQ